MKGRVEQTRTQSSFRRELWLDGNVAGGIPFEEDVAVVMSFPDAVFAAHAKRVKDDLKIGIRWASPPNETRFDFRIAIEDDAARGGLQRWGSSDALPASETDLLEGCQCLVLDLATARALSSKRTSICHSHVSDVLSVQYTVTRRSQ